MAFADKMAEAVRRSQKYMPAEIWAQVQALLTPEALALMATVTAAWAISHFFGVGAAADAVLVVTGGLIYGAAALQIGKEFFQFASGVQTAKTDDELEAAAKHFANAVVLGGVTVLSAILFKSKPQGTFREPFYDGPAPIPRPGPRGPGIRYKPTVTEKPLRDGELGVTTTYGDIIIDARLPRHVKVETRYHERVHQFFTPKLYFLRDVRVTMRWEGYNRSYLLRYLEEVLAEGYALLRTQGGGFISAMRFPVMAQPPYVTVAKMGEEARGIVLGNVNVGGLAFQVFSTNR